MLYTTTTGTGPDLVLLHGWGLNGEIWGDVVDTLASRRRVTLVDLAGHGRSGMPDGAYDLDHLAAFVAPAIPAGAAVLGWSLGGLVATRLAAREPQRVERLILLASTPRLAASPDWPHALSPDVLAQFARELEYDYAGTLERFLALQVAAITPAMRGTLRELRARMSALPPRPDALRGALQILLNTDLRYELKNLNLPVFALYGGRDRLVPAAAAQAMRELLPRGARVEIMPAAGHAPFLSHPAQFVQALESFLDD